MENKFEFKLGDKIQFTASRIQKGNPVSGKIMYKDETGFGVHLDHKIEGLIDVWEAGEIRRFGFWNTHSYKLIEDEKK